MAAAVIRIDQAGHPTQEVGIAGRSRDDIQLGSPVTLNNADNTGVRSWQWKLVHKPEGSAAALSNSVDASPEFVPDVVGSYLIELTVNEGRTGEKQRRLVAVRDANDFRFPAAGETNEANWGGNTQGWHPDLTAILKATVQVTTLGVRQFSEFGGDPGNTNNATALAAAVTYFNANGGGTLLLQSDEEYDIAVSSLIQVTAPLRICALGGRATLNFTGSTSGVFDLRAELNWDRVDARGWSSATDDFKLIDITETTTTIPKIRVTHADFHDAPDGWILYSFRRKADMSDSLGAAKVILRDVTGYNIAWGFQLESWHCNRVLASFCHFYDIEENALWFGYDKGVQADFQSQGDYTVESSIFERIGDGSAQSDPDRHAIIMFGRRCKVVKNTIIDVDNDTANDCEGIYLKVAECIVAHNICHNAGLGQAAIAIKGTERGSLTPGHNVDVSHNMVTNDPSRPLASAISLGDGGEVICSYNTCDGMTDTAIVIGGEDQHDVTVTWNRIINTVAINAVLVSSPGAVVRFEHNYIDGLDGGTGNAVGLQVLNGSSPGVPYQHVRVANNEFRNFTGTGSHNCGVFTNMTQNPSAILFEIIENLFENMEHGIKFEQPAPRFTRLLVFYNDFSGCAQDPPITGVANLLTQNTRFLGNIGFRSENSGSVTFVAQTRVTVTHGLHWSKRLERRIILTPFGSTAIPDSGPWVDSGTSTSFDIVFGATTSVSVGWTIAPHIEDFP